MDCELSKEFKVPSWFERVKFEEESDGVKDGAFTSWGKRIPRSGLQSHGSAKRGDTRLDPAAPVPALAQSGAITPFQFPQLRFL